MATSTTCGIKVQSRIASKNYCDIICSFHNLSVVLVCFGNCALHNIREFDHGNVKYTVASEFICGRRRQPRRENKTMRVS